MAAALGHAPQQLRAVRPQQTAQSDIYGQLRQAILEGQFRPGQLISLRTLAAAFNVSPMPVREAASRLAAEGCLEIVNRRGVRVPRLDADKAREILRLRIDLEGMAVEQAARYITPIELKRAEVLDAALDEAADGQDLKSLLSTNMAFHFAIYRYARNDTLYDLIMTLWLRYAPTFVETLERMSDTDFSGSGFRDTHGALLLALRQGDGKSARRALVNDIRSPAEQLWGPID